MKVMKSFRLSESALEKLAALSKETNEAQAWVLEQGIDAIYEAYRDEENAKSIYERLQRELKRRTTKATG